MKIIRNWNGEMNKKLDSNKQFDAEKDTLKKI